MLTCSVASVSIHPNEYSGDYATNIMHSYYFIWRSAKYSKHLAIYYNTGFKRYIYINGVCQNQIEPMIPEIPVVTLGIAATKLPGVLRVKLRLIQQIVMVFPYFMFIFSFLADHVHSQ